MIAAPAAFLWIAPAHAETVQNLPVLEASIGRGDTGRPVLHIRLTPEGAEAFGRFTAGQQRKVIDVLVDGEVVVSPMIMSPIHGGHLVVSGDFSEAELKGMALRLAEGTSRVQVRPAAP